MSGKNLFTSNFSNTDLGLLIIRVVIGASVLVLHGWGKITAGPEQWERLGGNMAKFHVTFAPVFWGFMAALAESLGSALLILGVLFRPAAVVLAFTMFVASMRHLSLPADAANSGLSGASHALELLAIYLGLLAAGPGKYRFGASGK